MQAALCLVLVIYHVSVFFFSPNGKGPIILYIYCTTTSPWACSSRVALLVHKVRFWVRQKSSSSPPASEDKKKGATSTLARVRRSVKNRTTRLFFERSLYMTAQKVTSLSQSAPTEILHFTRNAAFRFQDTRSATKCRKTEKTNRNEL